MPLLAQGSQASNRSTTPLPHAAFEKIVVLPAGGDFIYNMYMGLNYKCYFLWQELPLTGKSQQMPLVALPQWSPVCCTLLQNC